MDPDLAARARARAGVVAASELGPQPSRTARRAGLELVQPHAFVASTQPVDASVLAVAVDLSARGRHAFLGRTALWLHGVASKPSVVEVGVRHGTTLASGHRWSGRRVSADVLARTRMRHGLPVVDLEMAVVQASAKRPHAEVVALLEPLLRERRTTSCGSGEMPARARRLRGGPPGGRRAGGREHGEGGAPAAHGLEERGVTGLRAEVRFTSSAGPPATPTCSTRPAAAWWRWTASSPTSSGRGSGQTDVATAGCRASTA
jgi:hypothetical protein